MPVHEGRWHIEYLHNEYATARRLLTLTDYRTPECCLLMSASPASKPVHVDKSMSLPSLAHLPPARAHQRERNRSCVQRLICGFCSSLVPS